MPKLDKKKWEAFTWRGVVFKRSVLYPGNGVMQWKSDAGLWVHTNGPPSAENQCVAFLSINLVGFYESKGIGNDPIKALENAFQVTKANQKKIVRQYLEAEKAIDELEKQ